MVHSPQPPALTVADVSVAQKLRMTFRARRFHFVPSAMPRCWNRLPHRRKNRARARRKMNGTVTNRTRAMAQISHLVLWRQVALHSGLSYIECTCLRTMVDVARHHILWREAYGRLRSGSVQRSREGWFASCYRHFTERRSRGWCCVYVSFCFVSHLWH